MNPRSLTNVVGYLLGFVAIAGVYAAGCDDADPTDEFSAVLTTLPPCHVEVPDDDTTCAIPMAAPDPIFGSLAEIEAGRVMTAEEAAVELTMIEGVRVAPEDLVARGAANHFMRPVAHVDGSIEYPVGVAAQLDEYVAGRIAAGSDPEYAKLEGLVMFGGYDPTNPVHTRWANDYLGIPTKRNGGQCCTATCYLRWARPAGHADMTAPYETWSGDFSNNRTSGWPNNDPEPLKLFDFNWNKYRHVSLHAYRKDKGSDKVGQTEWERNYTNTVHVDVMCDWSDSTGNGPCAGKVCRVEGEVNVDLKSYVSVSRRGGGAHANATSEVEFTSWNWRHRTNRTKSFTAEVEKAVNNECFQAIEAGVQTTLDQANCSIGVSTAGGWDFSCDVVNLGALVRAIRACLKGGEEWNMYMDTYFTAKSFDVKGKVAGYVDITPQDPIFAAEDHQLKVKVNAFAATSRRAWGSYGAGASASGDGKITVKATAARNANADVWKNFTCSLAPPAMPETKVKWIELNNSGTGDRFKSGK